MKVLREAAGPKAWGRREWTKLLYGFWNDSDDQKKNRSPTGERYDSQKEL